MSGDPWPLGLLLAASRGAEDVIMAGYPRRAVRGSRSGGRRRGRAPELARFGGGSGAVFTERKYLACLRGSIWTEKLEIMWSFFLSIM